MKVSMKTKNENYSGWDTLNRKEMFDTIYRELHTRGINQDTRIKDCLVEGVRLYKTTDFNPRECGRMAVVNVYGK